MIFCWVFFMPRHVSHDHIRSGIIYSIKKNHPGTCCIHLNKLKRVNKSGTKNLTLDIFWPQLGFAENPFAPSYDLEPSVFVRTPRDSQETPPLYCFTHKGRKEGYGVLATNETLYSTGVFCFGNSRTLTFFSAAELFSPKEKKKHFFSLLWFSAKKKRKRAG